MEHYKMRVVELRSKAKELGLKRYSKMNKAELIELLKSEATQPLESNSTPIPPPRSAKRSRPVQPVKIVPSPRDIELFEEEEMKKNRPAVRNELNDFWNWLVNHVPKNAEKSAIKSFKKFKKEVMGLFKKDKSFTLSEKSFEKAYQSFRVEGSGIDVDAFFENNKHKLMDLIESKLHHIGSAKI